MLARASQTADLQVEVSDTLGVEILNAVQDLFEKLCSLLLCQRFLLSQEVKQFSSRHQLQDQDHVCFVFKDVVQGDDVAVLDLPQDVHFTLNLFPTHSSATGRQPPLLDKLGCILNTSALLLTLSDDGKLSAAGRTMHVNKHKRAAQQSYLSRNWLAFPTSFMVSYPWRTTGQVFDRNYK